MSISKGIAFRFKATPWQYDSPGGWYFVTLPISLSKEIRENLKWQEEGWGRIKAIAQTGESEWKTAIWYDTKKGSYLLPLKAAIRKSEGIEINKEYPFTLWI